MHRALLQPDPLVALGVRPAVIRFQPVAIRAADVAPLRLAGAWTLTSADPRFGGVSALALDGSGFLALTDAGVLIRFPKPAGRAAPAWISELPAGPGRRLIKFNRDSESLARDAQGRGWWVGFENRNEVWLYDPAFRKALRRVKFGRRRWPENKGLEGLVAEPGGLLLWPERGNEVVRWRPDRVQPMPINPSGGRVSDAARLPSGDIVVIHRHWSLAGFRNAVTIMKATANGGYAPVRTWLLRGFARDNFEGIAAEPTPGGGTRVWLVTDDNQQPPLRTLLLALDVPKALGA